jgi:hypothetical protein
MSPQN